MTKKNKVSALTLQDVDHLNLNHDTKEQIFPGCADQSGPSGHISLKCHDSLGQGEERDWLRGNKNVSDGPTGGGNTDHTRDPGEHCVRF